MCYYQTYMLRQGGGMRLKAEKQPGCSWIEDKNQLHVFLSDDGVQPQLPDISDTLNNLTAQMKTCSFMPKTIHDYV